MADNLELKDILKRELPALLREDPALRDYVIELTRHRYADRQQSEDRFNQLLQELRDDRIAQSLRWEEQSRRWKELNQEQNRKWDEQNHKWEEQNRRWDEFNQEQNRKWDEQNHKWEEQNRRWDEFNQEQNRKWDEQNHKWEEQNRRWDEFNQEQNRKWDEQNHKWEEQNRRWDEFNQEQNRKWDEQNHKWDEQKIKWDEQDRKFQQIHEEIMAQAKKFDRSIGALGARWGMQSEKAFRNALAGILEENFGVQVINANEYDDLGEVFGRPEQIELDIIVKNGVLLICELKSSIDKAGMYSFERKARFYEKRHGRKASRLIVVSPMIDDKARKVGQTLGIEMYSDSLDVQLGED